MQRMRKYLLAWALVAVVPVVAFGKRSGPAEVPPVTHDGVVYVVVPFAAGNQMAQHGGYIEARDAKTNAKIWGLQVYTTKYDKNLERDVQDVFITSMTMDSEQEQLIIKNEKGRVFKVDINKRRVVQEQPANKT